MNTFANSKHPIGLLTLTVALAATSTACNRDERTGTPEPAANPATNTITTPAPLAPAEPARDMPYGGGPENHDGGKVEGLGSENTGSARDMAGAPGDNGAKDNSPADRPTHANADEHDRGQDKAKGVHTGKDGGASQSCAKGEVLILASKNGEKGACEKACRDNKDCTAPKTCSGSGSSPVPSMGGRIEDNGKYCK